MVAKDEGMVMVTVNEFVKLEDQELHAGDSILCDIPETLEPGDLALAQVTEDGLLIIGRVRHFSILTDAGRRASGGQQQA